MGDYTYHQIEIIDCPPSSVRAVLDVLDEHGFGGASGDELTLCEEYTGEDLSLGTLDAVTAVLDEESVAYYGWADPKYEFHGYGEANAPGVGGFTFTCFQDGNPVHTNDEVRKMLDDPASAPAILGTVITDALDLLREANKGRVLTALPEDD